MWHQRNHSSSKFSQFKQHLQLLPVLFHQFVCVLSMVRSPSYASKNSQHYSYCKNCTDHNRHFMFWYIVLLRVLLRLKDDLLHWFVVFDPFRQISLQLFLYFCARFDSLQITMLNIKTFIRNFTVSCANFLKDLNMDLASALLSDKSTT